MTTAAKTRLVISQELRWKGHGHPSEQRKATLFDSYCQLDIYENEGGHRYVLFSQDSNEDFGASITNSAENIATMVAQRLSAFDPEKTTFIEHYSAYDGHPKTDLTMGDRFSIVLYAWDDNNKASKPGWMHLNKTALEAMLGFSLDNPPAWENVGKLHSTLSQLTEEQATALTLYRHHYIQRHSQGPDGWRSPATKTKNFMPLNGQTSNFGR